MILFTEYDIGDLVKCGPIEGLITGINFRSAITYLITYWDENKAIDYTAYSWELKLLQKGNIDDRDNNKDK